MKSKRGQKIIVLLAVGASLALAEESAIVHRKSLDVRSAKSLMSPVSFTAKQGDTLQITDHGADGWLSVKGAAADTQSGFVREASLFESKAKLTSANSSAVSGSRDADASAATKGLDPDAVKYASTKSYDTAAVTRMIDTRESIKPADLDQFRQEGGLK